MNASMRIGWRVPAGFKPTGVYLELDKPIDEMRAAERLWQGDFIKKTESGAVRCRMEDATHAMCSPNAEAGAVVQCYPLCP